jgi:hypothetical protein
MHPNVKTLNWHRHGSTCTSRLNFAILRLLFLNQQLYAITCHFDSLRFPVAFFANGQTAIDNSPRINATAANCVGPSDPQFVVKRTKHWLGIRRRKPARTKNITALMMNDPGSIRLLPDISSQE